MVGWSCLQSVIVAICLSLPGACYCGIGAACSKSVEAARRWADGAATSGCAGSSRRARTVHGIQSVSGTLGWACHLAEWQWERTTCFFIPICTFMKAFQTASSHSAVPFHLISVTRMTVLKSWVDCSITHAVWFIFPLPNIEVLGRETRCLPLDAVWPICHQLSFLDGSVWERLVLRQLNLFCGDGSEMSLEVSRIWGDDSGVRSPGGPTI